MSEEIQGVEEVEAVTTPEPTETNEQAEEQDGATSDPVDGKDYKAIAEQLSRDIKEKNRKIQELKAQTSQPRQQEPTVTQPVISEDETVRRFLKTEANATIAVKLQTDPSFKDRVEIVQAYVEQGYDINMADKLAKSDIMDKILTEASTQSKHNIPQQIQPSAIPEAKKARLTGNSLDDIQKGLVGVDLPDADALREVIAKYRPQR